MSASSSSSATKPEETIQSLTALAQKQYSLKNYSEAADLYGRACELQTKEHDGNDNDPRNAELLFLYGKALFQVALSKSDVLGGNSAPTEADAGKGKASEKKKEDATPSATRKGAVVNIAGDENFLTDDESSGSEDDEKPEGEDDDDDDFSIAWSILDLARVLFQKRLDSLPPTHTPEDETPLKTQLADALDLLGELSLESESFSQAATDLSSALDLKQTLYPPSSNLLSEAHYKLSLALEFSAEDPDLPADQKSDLRARAQSELESAIHASKLRVAEEEEKLAALLPTTDPKGKGKAVALDLNPSPSDSDTIAKSKAAIKDVKEMIHELQSRLNDMKQAAKQASLPVDPKDPLASVFANALAAGGAGEAKKKLEEVMRGANDISGLIKKKPLPVVAEVKKEEAVKTEESKVEEKKEDKKEEAVVVEKTEEEKREKTPLGKRKAEEDLEVQVTPGKGVPDKKARVEEVKDDEA